MLALVGAFNVVEGLIAIYARKLVRLDPDRLLLDLAGWAQVTLALGALLLALGIWLSVVTVRVRLIALSVVVVHALIQLGVLAAFPAWALLMISFDVVIIFALTATPAGTAASAARGGDTRDTAAGASGNSPARRVRGVASLGRVGGRDRRAPAERIGYRPRHQMAAAVVVGAPGTELPGTELAGSSDEPTTPRALPPGPPAGPARAAMKPGTTAPATATMVGAVARTDGGVPPSNGGRAGPVPPATARGVATPIIGAISGRWPEMNGR
ncbi:hypothetical protein Pme01_20450 [Planosporangium mesophilum]|uniref:DUF7144 domain-containing protein n=2 Tax=Planosporangium mesophilum TaxID=689768 RepID=A0A8J3T9Q1_9ACTN|nr:hypothetical protein Pme01_20450 [Planosporangium mesophilum]